MGSISKRISLELQAKDRLDIRLGLRANISTVQPHDLPREAQADPRTVLSGGEKRDEDFVSGLLCNARPIVFHLYHWATVHIHPRHQIDATVPFAFQRLSRVHKKVEQHLFQEIRTFICLPV